MDIDNLVKALAVNVACEETRKANELYIESMKPLPNFLPILLTIACDLECKFNHDVQLNAAIQLKNHIINNWKFSDDTDHNHALIFDENEIISVINKQDKEYIKASIIDALDYSCTSGNVKLMKQLNQCIKKIIRLEFRGAEWRQFFMEKVLSFLKSSDDKKIYSGINICCQLSKMYEFESGDFKREYNESFDILNEYFLSFLGHLTSDAVYIGKEEGALYIYKILKIFFKTIQTTLPNAVMEDKYFEQWMTAMVQVVQCRVHEHEHEHDDLFVKREKLDDITAMNRNIHWKLRKIIFQTILRIFQKNSCIATCDNNKRHQEFAELVHTKYSHVYYKIMIESLYVAHSSNSIFFTDDALCNIYKFFSLLISRNHLLLSDLVLHLDTIKDWLIQDAMLTPQDFDLCHNDPKGYISNQFEVTGFYYVKRYAVAQFIKNIVSFRPVIPGKKNKHVKIKIPPYFEGYFRYFVSVIEMYENESAKGNKPDPKIKESVMFIIQSIHKEVFQYAPPETIEKLIEIYIVKEFSSSHWFLRERACTFIDSYSKFTFVNSDLVHIIMEKICIILEQDHEFPVRVMSAVVAPKLLRHGNVKTLLKNHVDKLLEIYLSLMNQIDLEEILGGLETIISSFHEEVKKYAVLLSSELVKYFKKRILNNENTDDSEDCNIGFLMSDGIIRSLITIVELFVNDSEIFPQLEVPIEEIIRYGLSSDGFDEMEDILELIHQMLKRVNRISEKTWSYFSELVYTIIGTDEENEELNKTDPGEIYEGLGMEYMEEIIQIICYFILKGQSQSHFLTCIEPFGKKNYLALTMSLVKRVIDICKKNQEYEDIRYAFKVLIVLMETYKGQIDTLVTEILTFVINEVAAAHEKTYSYLQYLIELFATCLVYNPTLCIHFLEGKDALEGIFTCWFNSLENLQFSEYLRRSLLGLCSVITVDPNLQSKLIISHMQLIVNQIIVIAEKIDNIKRSDNITEHKWLEIEDEDEEEKEKEEEKEEEEVNNPSREEILDKNIKEAQKKMNEEPMDDELLEDGDSDEDYDMMSDFSLITDMDKQCEVLFLRDSLNMLMQTQPVYYQQLISVIDQNNREKLMKIIKSAEIRNEKK